MLKRCLVVVIVSAVVPAFADVVEPTVEPSEPAPLESDRAADPASEPPVRGPSMVAPRSAETAVLDDGTPPLSGGRIVGEALLGSLFAVGGGIGGAYTGAYLEISNGCSSELCGLGGAILGGTAGLAFITPVGVYLAGSHSGQTASFGATLGGSIVGTLAGIGLVAASEDESSWPVLFIAPVVGSMIGFNLTRKYDGSHKPKRQWAPVANVSSGNSTFGVAGAF